MVLFHILWFLLDLEDVWSVNGQSDRGWISRESRSAAPTAEISHSLIGYEGQIHWTEIVQQKSSVQQDIIFTDIIYTCWNDVYVTLSKLLSFHLQYTERTVAIIDYELSEHVYLCRIRVMMMISLCSLTVRTDASHFSKRTDRSQTAPVESS